MLLKQLCCHSVLFLSAVNYHLKKKEQINNNFFLNFDKTNYTTNLTNLTENIIVFWY